MISLMLVHNSDVPEARRARIAYDLGRDLSRAGVPARPVQAPAAEGERGDAALVGQLALTLVSSGAVTVLFECLKAYLSRERSLAIVLTRADGLKVEVTSRNVDSAAVQKALQLATANEPR